MVTIEDIFRRGEISTHTWNICISNQIKTFSDLKRHYMERNSFRNLQIEDEKCYDELIEVYYKYEDLNIEIVTTQPEPVSESKIEVKLEEVVTDFDEVFKPNLTVDASLKEIEQKLKEYWSAGVDKEITQVDTTQIDTNKSSVKATSEKDAVDLGSIEQKLEEYWSEIAEKNAVDSLRSIERKLEEYWKNESAENKTLQNKDQEPSIKAISRVTDVVDLENIKRTIEDYKRKQESDESPNNNKAASSVKSTSGSTYITNLSKLEQRLKKHWREKANEAAKESNAKSKSTFGRHPSKKLNDLYSKRSYQGANPVDAKVLFVGRDPNWPDGIDGEKMFKSVEEYLTDGISFWKKNRIHHPFLLPGYVGDGRRYHKLFSKLNLDSSVANKISFVELIGFPTTGMARSNGKVFKEYLLSKENRNHLIELDKLLNDTDKMIFIAWGLTNDFKFLYERTRLFKKFAKLNKSEMDINDLNQFENIYIHRHFSDAISNDTLAKMEVILKQELV